MTNELSAAAALDVQRLQRTGYRGFAVLYDPRTGQMTLFHVEADGCERVMVGDVPAADEAHAVIALPGLVVPPDANPDVVATRMRAEIERITSRLH